MKRFRKITDGLYRGGAPSINEVKYLKKHLGINKIISLDKHAGERINNICKSLHIDHKIFPLNGNRKELLKLLSHDLYELLIEGGPTFIHCAAGKDRSGFLAAMFKCLYMGWTYDEAMDEAKSLGFGIGVTPSIIKMYTDVLKEVCSQQQHESIVDNERSYISDNDGRGSYLTQGHQGSFAPFISTTRQYPYDNPYNTINDQSPTRDNYDHLMDPYAEIGTSPDSDDLPAVGMYDNNAGTRGFGPAEPYGGFLHD